MIERLLALALLSTAIAAAEPPAPVLEPLKYRVVYDGRITRPRDDDRICIWTPKPARVGDITAQYDAKMQPPKMDDGDICAAFFNDTITEALTGVVFNETAGETFADYADSGIRFKLSAPPDGMKYSRVTIVYFTPAAPPARFGIRGMIPGGTSERSPED
jgi:hypothetical protein